MIDNTLQADLDKLARWSEIWLLKFNVEKCKVMHIGHTRPTKYFMSVDQAQYQLDEVTEERDLGIMVTSDLKPSTQCAQAALKKQCPYSVLSGGRSRQLM